MSLSWNESLRVALCPRRAGLVRMSRGWRQRIIEGSVTTQPASEAGNPPWAGALAALSEGIAGMNGHGAEVTVVLSNHFARYLLVPRNDALLGEAEALAHARHFFIRAYGAIAESWDIRLSSANGGPQVACAIDAELLSGLDQAVAASGRRLVSVQPYLMAAFNRWRRELLDPVAWFVLAEQDRICLAAFKDGHWRQLTNLQTGSDWVRRLPELLARQRRLSGLDEVPGKVYLFAPDEHAGPSLQHAGEAVRSLRAKQQALRTELSAGEAACLEMALNG